MTKRSTGPIAWCRRCAARYPKFSHEASLYMEDTIGQIESCCRFVEAEACGIDLPDPDDVRYVDAAIAGGADAIITGNLRHFPERRHGQVQVLSVREFAVISGLADDAGEA